MTGPVVKYTRGAELPAMRIPWKVDGEKQDFSSGWTFSLTIGDLANPYVTKNTGITGFAANAVAQAVVEWAAGELDAVPAGQHLLRITARRTSDNKDDVRDFTLELAA